jgi:hypothetical protein
MSEAQQKCLDDFKAWIVANKVTENPWHKDYFFLKFCRARKFDLKKVIEMFTNYMKYRTDNDLDNIITVSTIHQSYFNRASISHKRLSWSSTTQRGTAVYARLADPFILRDLGSSRSTMSTS